MKYKLNLTLKFFFYIFGIFLVLFFVLSNLYLKQTKMALEDKVLNQAKIIVRLSNLVIVNDITNYNDIALLNYIEKIESVDNVLYAIILSKNGTVLGHSDVYEMGTVYTDKLSKWAISVTEFLYQGYFDNGKEIFVCAAPISDAKLGTIAYIRLGMSRAIIVEQMQKIKKEFLIAAATFVMIFCILFFTIFYVEIARPISLMKDGVKLMKNSLTKFKFTIHKKDEIGDLFININNLAEDMMARINTFDNQKDLVLSCEQKRIENILEMFNKDSDIIIADNDNKIIFYQDNLQLFNKEELLFKHIMDVIKDSDIVGMIADAYSTKQAVTNINVKIKEKQYVVTVFVVKEVSPFVHKTIVTVRPFIEKKKITQK